MSTLWEGVDRLLDRAPQASTSDLAAHGLHLLAARRWAAAGRPIPPELLAAERAAVMATLAVPSLLHRVRAAVDGPIILLKGPEVAARYPAPALRPFWDLDILVQDSEAAQQALLAAGFKLLGPHEFAHQERAIHWPGLPLNLAIEVHRAPFWPHWMTPPSNDDLFAIAVPSRTGVEGILTLPDREHALFLAAHSWRHNPLRSVGDLIDVLAMSEGVARAELASLARQWGLSRVWTLTERTGKVLLLTEQSADMPPVPRWARHLPAIRDRTVAERHLLLWLSVLGAPSPASAVRAFGAVFGEDIRPLWGEAWPAKLARVGRAVQDSFKPASDRSKDPCRHPHQH